MSIFGISSDLFFGCAPSAPIRKVPNSFGKIAQDAQAAYERLNCLGDRYSSAGYGLFPWLGIN